MIGATGSLATNNAAPKSDIDFFIIATPKRIWLCRLICSFVTHIAGIRRYGTHIQDRICLNYYVSGDNLELHVKNLSNAHTYASLIPILDTRGHYKAFQEQNKWMKQYLTRFPWNHAHSKWYQEKTAMAKKLSRTFEILLENPIGDSLEAMARFFQERKISKNVPKESLTRKDHLILSDGALMFHFPVSRNAEVEKNYQETIGKIGIS